MFCPQKKQQKYTKHCGIYKLAKSITDAYWNIG